MNEPLPDQPVHQPSPLFPIFLGLFIVLVMGAIAAYYLSLHPQQKARNTVPTPTVAQMKPTATPMAQPTPSSEPQSRWKTYKDRQNIFTVRHPSSFYQTPEVLYGGQGAEQPLGVLSTVTPYNNGLDLSSDMRLEFGLLSLPQDMSLEQYIQSRVLTIPREDTEGDGKVDPPVVITPSKREVIHPDGTDTIWLEGLAYMSVPHAEVFIPYRENKIIHVRIYDGTGPQEHRDQESYTRNMRLAGQIIATFQFL